MVYHLEEFIEFLILFSFFPSLPETFFPFSFAAAWGYVRRFHLPRDPDGAYNDIDGEQHIV